MAKKNSENYLDYIPVYHPDNTWDENDGKVTINMVHKGIYDKIAQKLFHRPRVSHIDLDEYGSFLWQQIDGKKTIGELAVDFKAQFGEKAEPLYDRLVHYMQVLRNNHFILLKGKDRIPE